jgi:hypothetical protein
MSVIFLLEIKIIEQDRPKQCYRGKESMDFTKIDKFP